MFLLLTVSGSMAADHPGYCQSPSGAFHGPCFKFRSGECNDKCIHEDHQDFGECDTGKDFWGRDCYCYHHC
ncbi:hypothetical protein SUGI_0909240 [Cryptomeria japonica]|nr:hypothetical protein SUGI_0909240 [Cryptomeria japonica]